MLEKITQLSLSTNNLTIDYSNASNTNIYYLIPTSSFSTFTLTLTNLPISETFGSFTITLLIDAISYKTYCNSIHVNSTIIPVIAVNGVSNLAVNASATLVLQQLTIFFLGNTVPSNVISSVLSLW
jgi:hypothetical protein